MSSRTVRGPIERMNSRSWSPESGGSSIARNWPSIRICGTEPVCKWMSAAWCSTPKRSNWSMVMRDRSFYGFRFPSLVIFPGIHPLEFAFDASFDGREF